MLQDRGRLQGCSRKLTLRDEHDFDEGGWGLEFRLTYAGELRASNNGRDERPARKQHKRDIRSRFHPQMKRLWESVPHLVKGQGVGESVMWINGPPSLKYDKDTVASRFAMYGWNFVPLITQDLKLSCWLDVLILRRQQPGSLLVGGDIDNRLKTLIDCLQIPDANQGYETVSPIENEKPFFCLLENDKLISKITIETDTLLEDLGGKATENDVRIVVTVRVRPYETTFLNVQFA